MRYFFEILCTSCKKFYKTNFFLHIFKCTMLSERWLPPKEPEWKCIDWKCQLRYGGRKWWKHLSTDPKRKWQTYLLIFLTHSICLMPSCCCKTFKGCVEVSFFLCSFTFFSCILSNCIHYIYFRDLLYPCLIYVLECRQIGLVCQEMRRDSKGISNT